MLNNFWFDVSPAGGCGTAGISEIRVNPSYIRVVTSVAFVVSAFENCVRVELLVCCDVLSFALVLTGCTIAGFCFVYLAFFASYDLISCVKEIYSWAS